MIDEPYRIIQVVTTAIPDLPQDRVNSARADVRRFDESNGQLIRRGDLIISVPSDVADRLQASYGILDQNLENARRRQEMTRELNEESRAFNLDPQNFTLGRLSRAALEMFGGVAAAVATVGSLYVRRWNTRR